VCLKFSQFLKNINSLDYVSDKIDSSQLRLSPTAQPISKNKSFDVLCLVKKTFQQLTQRDDPF